MQRKPIDFNKEVDRLYKKAFPIDSERDRQLERDVLQWKEYFEKNRGKIAFPKTIFDLDNK